MFRWKWKAAAAAGMHWHHVPPRIDLAVAPATHTCPIVPRILRRGVLELRNANMMVMSRGRGIAHRGTGAVVVVIARLSVNGGGGRRRRSAGSRAAAAAVVLDWPWT